MSENNLCVAHNPWPTCPNCAIEILNTRLDEAKKEIERLNGDLTQHKTKTHCAYCGEDFLLDTVTAEQVGQHILNCPKHPIADFKLALAARDVIIGVKDGALREALPSCDRDGCDKPALYEQTQRGHTWTECEEHADESIKLQPQYYLRYPLSKTALSIDPNEVAEAINGLVDVLDWISGGISCVIGETPNEISPMGCINHKHGFSCKASEAKLLYDKALKGVVSK